MRVIIILYTITHIIVLDVSNSLVPEIEKDPMQNSFAYVRLARGFSPRTADFARWKNMQRQSFHSRLKEALRRQVERVKDGFIKQKIEDKRLKNEKRRKDKILNFIQRNPILSETIRLGFVW